MENELENLNSQNEDEVVEDLDALKEKLAKTEETNKQLFARAKTAEGELKELKGKTKEEKLTPEASLVKPGELDYGQLAFYNSKSDSVKIEHDEDIEFLKSTIEETGKSQQIILNSKWFASDLKEKQAVRATQDAIPSSTGRSTPSAKDTVDYWLAKGDLPPTDQIQLRRDVLNARIEGEKSGDKFTDKPFIGNV